MLPNVTKDPRNWTEPLELSTQRRADMRLGTWNVMSLYRLGSLEIIASQM